MSKALPEHHCSVCGTPLQEDPKSVMTVEPDSTETGKVTYYCGEHNPTPPSLEQLAEAKHQELDAAAAYYQSREEGIRQLIDLDRPVTPSDRTFIGEQLLEMQRRWLVLYNEVQELQGKPRIPDRPSRPYRSGRSQDAPEEEFLEPPPPQYRIVVEHLWDPTSDEQPYKNTDVRWEEVMEAITRAGARFVGGSPGEVQTSAMFYAPTDDVVDEVRQSLNVPGRHRVSEIQYLPRFPYGAPRTIWRPDDSSA